MSYRIVMDSSSDIYDTGDGHCGSAPLHINIDGQDFADVQETDMNEFDRALEQAYAQGKPCSSSCPSPGEWMQAFADAKEVYCITITHALSSSYNAAMTAANLYEEEHPERKVYVIDSLATGGRLLLIYDYLKALLDQGVPGAEAVRRVQEYRDRHTVLMFTLQSVNRLASTGRISPIIAKAIGVMDLRLIGIASSKGTIELVGKHRGAAKVMKGTFEKMLKYGYNGGRVVISHVHNEEDVRALKELIRQRFGEWTRVDIHPARCLDSFYAESRGYIVGFEKG